MRLWNQKDAVEVVRDGIELVFPRLWRYCLVLASSRTQADDLAQAACLRALERAEQYKADSHFDRWIFRITQRLWVDEMRRQSVRHGGGLSSIEEAELVDANPNPEEKMMDREVVMAVMRLPEAQRMAVMLVYVEGYAYREAADILDIPVGTVMSRLSVARGKLVDILRDRAEAG